MNSRYLLLFTLCISSVLYNCDAWAKLKVKFVSFTNSRKHDFWDRCCDPFCNSCDTMFDLCFDKHGSPTQNENHHSCYYLGPTPGREYANTDSVTFTNIIRGYNQDTNNPIELRFQNWNGKVQMKVNVMDDDSGHSGHDKIDEMFYTIEGIPARTSGVAPANHRSITGLRKRRHGRTETKLDIYYYLFCEENYFTSSCNVYCKPRDDHWGHYICNSYTGAKVCKTGWEGVNCDIWWNDCEHDRCSDNSICIDGPSSTYICTCFVGYTGQYCDVDIDECASSPCQENATCVDKVGLYECDCPPGFLGKTCHLHICQEDSPCLNNGSCYGSGQCLCPPGFSGDRCETDLCTVIQCHNGGTCKEGTCLCPKGFQGLQCDVDECSIRQCHNNGTCHLGDCICNGTGYYGSSCQKKINECESIPCQHNGECEDLHKGYTCLCQYPYVGENCELMQTTTTNTPLGVVGFTPDDDGSSTTYSPEQKPWRVHQNSPTIPVAVSLSIIALLALLAILLVLVIRKKRKKERENNSQANFDNPVYETAPGTCSINPADPPPGYNTEPVMNNYVPMGGGQATLPTHGMQAGALPSKQVLQEEDPYASINDLAIKTEPPPYSPYDNLPPRVGNHSSVGEEEGAVNEGYVDDIKVDLDDEKREGLSDDEEGAVGGGAAALPAKVAI